MQNKLLLFILLLLLSISGFSQFHIIVSGQVFSSDTNEPLSYSQVILNHDKGVITNDSGQFRMPVKAGDTVSATYLGYTPVEYVIPDTLPNNEYVLGFFLSIDPLHISEVIIFPKYTAAELKRQMTATMPLSLEEQNARQNIDVATGTALRTNNLYENPEQYQDVMIGKQQVRTEYKGMMSPDQIAGVNFVTVIGLAYHLIKQNLQPQEDDKLYVRERDTRKLWQLYSSETE